MAKEINLWTQKFSREAKVKSSIILSGNTQDIFLDETNGNYIPCVELVVKKLKVCGYENIILWDRIEGTNVKSGKIEINESNSNQSGTSDYDFGDDSSDTQSDNSDNGKHKEPSEFFPYLLNVIKNGNGKNAFILDYSDYLFGNANSLSEVERNYLSVLGKTIRQSQPYDLGKEDFFKTGNIVVFITQSSGTIPPSFYLHNPMVSTINIPLPGRNEREQFVNGNLPLCGNIKNLSDKRIQDDFVDALDDFTLRDIAQIIKVSRQTDETLSFEKLINLYKYGEKTSPWEELSKDKLQNIEETLKKRVKGQDEAVAKVKDVIIRAFTGFAGLQHSAKQKKPKGTLFFVGPTGVGKTELAKALAEFVFGDENACIRFDMSEYNHEHSDQRLVGAPPGYVGYEAGGQLTNAVKEKPFCVILFDEIEKAHGKILDKFLQILEDGRLTDGKGETISFAETIIIFTSNIGAATVNHNLNPKEIKSQFVDAVKKHFIEELGRPELLNRIGDNIVAFNFISGEEVFANIAKSKFAPVTKFVKEKYKTNLVFDDENAAYKTIAQKAGIANGGRGLLNVIESVIINPLSEWIFMRSDMIEGRTIKIVYVSALKSFDFELE